jgi:DNA-binding transcriptional MerR regulator
MAEQGSENPRQKRSVRRVKLKRPPERLYYSISDVGEMIGVKPYVLRFWEKEFPTLRPKKNRAGNRIYQKKDIQLVEKIRDLLYKDGFTILGARQKLKSERMKTTSAAAGKSRIETAKEWDEQKIKEELGEIRREVEELIALFS